MKAVRLLGLDISDIGIGKATGEILSMIEKEERFSVFTPNAEALYLCRRDKKALDAFRSAGMLVPDGSGLILASRLAGEPIKNGKVAGVELGERLLFEASRKEIPVFLFGGKPGVSERAGKRLAEKYPGLRIAGTLDGYTHTDEEVVSAVNGSGAKLLFVFLGMPRQEVWISEHQKELAPICAIGLGGSVDIYSGDKKRAPELLVKMRLEWLWRAVREPRRFRQVFHIPPVLLSAAKERGKR